MPATQILALLTCGEGNHNFVRYAVLSALLGRLVADALLFLLGLACAPPPLIPRIVAHSPPPCTRSIASRMISAQDLPRSTGTRLSGR